MALNIFKFSLLLFLFTSFQSFAAGSVELVDGRLKVQFRIDKNKSNGSFQLRSILEKHGFPNENGFVRTRKALAPLEIYNYLYDHGLYAFTIFLPIDDEKFFLSLDQKGFISINGIAAQRLFNVVKHYVSRRDINNLEQYNWAKGAYCDRTKSGEIKYRCFFDK